LDKSHLRDDADFRSRLDFFIGASAAWTHLAATESQRPRRNADAKALAAEIALFVSRQCGIEPTTTEDGKFARIAAALYGDLDAEMSHHCRAALKAEALHGAGIATDGGGTSAKPRVE
jgi:hypothetical protein